MQADQQHVYQLGYQFDADDILLLVVSTVLANVQAIVGRLQ